jgi:hypothetical protein
VLELEMEIGEEIRFFQSGQAWAGKSLAQPGLTPAGSPESLPDGT